ncbi:PREDICTED: uncharacterized protein LOC106813466 [Priapulus caudatus]|uniref:Uncharacterized protein LOC106813466 n=1 Tax=Priapulus caudatus TaxID=37621 RepID=A0ABM1ELL9_PRICU|nr:PREDICTED: uncharacterized protein LOC106813466 [Priapulus caudatus]
MSSLKQLDIGLFPEFDLAGDPSSVGPRWQKYLKAFRRYANAKGITDDGQKRDLLLKCGDRRLQDLYDTLHPEDSEEEEEGDGETTVNQSAGETGDGGGEGAAPVVVRNRFKETVEILSKHLVVQVNVPFERHMFKRLLPEANEPISRYITRLRERAANCEFIDEDDQIRDHIIHTYGSTSLRRKLLQTGKQLTLAKLQEIACAYEAVETQLEEMRPNETVHRVTGKPQRDKPIKGDKDRVYRKTLRPSQGVCYRCGQSGHYGKDVTCPAKGKQCRKCSNYGHYAKMCKSSDRTSDSWKPKRGKVQLGGVPVKMVIDSGASANIICQSLWEQLKEKRIKCASQKCTKQLFAYGSKVPLPVIGTFQCTAVVQNTQVNAEIMVVKGSGQPLLGKKTAKQLGVLKVGLNINTIASDSIEKEFEKCCTGVGKLTDYQIQLHIDESVQPVAQPVRRAPFALRDKIDQKLEELLNMDIIERVEGPTRWVSPLVVVPKPNGDIRVCVDMRQANKAIIRERHYIPTVDEVLHEMNNSKVFSKLDVKWGYHQVELNPESRDITTFVTHAGLFRYKRFMFGISAAPEKYQHVLEQVLAGCGASKTTTLSFMEIHKNMINAC